MRQIDTAHCQACGSTDPQDIGWDVRAANDGYTACCNERVVGGPRGLANKPAKCADPDGGDCYHD